MFAFISIPSEISVYKAGYVLAEIHCKYHTFRSRAT